MVTIVEKCNKVFTFLLSDVFREWCKFLRTFWFLIQHFQALIFFCLWKKKLQSSCLSFLPSRQSGLFLPYWTICTQSGFLLPLFEKKIRKCLEFSQKTFIKWSWICVSWYLEHYNFYSFFFLFFWQEMDPRTICWKGGAVLSILDSAQELWISQREWTSIGVRVLRERSPFIWTICN